MNNAQATYINLTAENLSNEPLCCIVRTKKNHPGVEAKRRWLANRLPEGHVYRKLDAKATVFIEYAPLETAWTPIVGDNFLYIYCLWVDSPYKGKNHGRTLMEYCINDAKAKGKSGVCMLGALKQKAWLANQVFAQKFGFQQVDATENGYTLLALSFDGSTPRFTEAAKAMRIDCPALTVFYSMQCPFIAQTIEKLQTQCAEKQVPLVLEPVDSLEKAKALPCVFNNWGVFYKGAFVTVNVQFNLDRLLA